MIDRVDAGPPTESAYAELARHARRELRPLRILAVPALMAGFWFLSWKVTRGVGLPFAFFLIVWGLGFLASS